MSGVERLLVPVLYHWVTACCSHLHRSVSTEAGESWGHSPHRPDVSHIARQTGFHQPPDIFLSPLQPLPLPSGDIDQLIPSLRHNIIISRRKHNTSGNDLRSSTEKNCSPPNGLSVSLILFSSFSADKWRVSIQFRKLQIVMIWFPAVVESAQNPNEAIIAK